MKIKLTTEQPIYRSPYRLAETEKETMRNMIKDLLEANIIRESVSPYAIPALLVNKKQGKQQ